MKIISPKLKRIRETFERVQKSQVEFFSSLPDIRRKVGPRYIPLATLQRERLCEMAFVVLLTAWEQFLEDAFQCYLVDAPLSGFKSRYRVLVADAETARDVIRGSRQYVECGLPPFFVPARVRGLSPCWIAVSGGRA
jgi:hypothetical protein